MMGFDEWFKEVNKTNDCGFTNKDFYEAGAASQQAEIDCLKVELDAANERAMMLLNHKNKMVDKLQGEIYELQKRIDDALKYVSESPLKDVSRKAMLNFLDILKGATP